MHSQRFMPNVLLALYLTLNLATRVCGQSFSLNSINLKGFEGCTDPNKIYEGWDDAIQIAKDLKDKINFNEAAGLEFFGPPAVNLGFQHFIKDVFEKASTFGQGSLFVPTPFKWDVYVTCDDYLNRCKNGPTAYTTNYVKNDPRGTIARGDQLKTATPVINFCPPYFQLKRLRSLLDEYQPRKPSFKSDLFNYYKNTATIVLHELMHVGAVADEANGGKRIYDLKFLSKENKEMLIYGPLAVKMLARWDNSWAGRLVTQNADNLALYALAKTVQNYNTYYPHLPIVNENAIKKVYFDGHWYPSVAAAVVAAIEAALDPNMPPIEENLNPECNGQFDSDTCESPGIELPDEFPVISDSEYGPEYVAQLNLWVAAQTAEEIAKQLENNLTSGSPVAVPNNLPNAPTKEERTVPVLFTV